MKAYSRGAKIESGELTVPDAPRGAPFIVRDLIGEFPHGNRFRARQGEVPVLLTVVDAVLVADVGARASVIRGLQAAQRASHRSLLPIYGFGTTGSGFCVAEADPGGSSVRKFARHRAARGKALDAETVFTLVGHLCNALAVLHQSCIHGFVTADTVLVASSGRIHLSSAGFGEVLPRARDFVRFRNAGFLPNIAPEQLLSPPQLTAGTDIHGVATLFLELLTGLPLLEAGQPISDLGLRGPEDLLMCLERATAPSLTARPPDMMSFKIELAEAIRAGPVVRGEARSTALDPLGSGGSSGASPKKTITDYGPITDFDDPGPTPPDGIPLRVPDSPPAVGERARASRVTPPDMPIPGYLTPPPQVARAQPPAVRPSPPAAPVRPVAPRPPPASRRQGAQARLPPPPAATRAAEDSAEALPLLDDLERLDEATQWLNALDDDEALSMTQLVDGADPDPPAPKPQPAPMPAAAPAPSVARAGASSSLLGLKLDSFDDVAARLSTLDGQHSVEGVDARGQALGPSQSGTFFGSFDPEIDRQIAARHAAPDAERPSSRPVAAVSAAAAANLEASDQRPLFFLVRRGEMTGPISPHELFVKGREGQLDLGDLLCHRSTGEEFEVRHVKILCEALVDHADREQLRNFARAAVRAKPLPTAGILQENRPPRSWRWLWTLLIVVVALAGFAVAGWYLSQHR